MEARIGCGRAGGISPSCNKPIRETMKTQAKQKPVFACVYDVPFEVLMHSKSVNSSGGDGGSDITLATREPHEHC